MLYVNIKKDLPLIMAEDEETLHFWDFAIGDYNREHWYATLMHRNDCLSGLLSDSGYEENHNRLFKAYHASS